MSLYEDILSHLEQRGLKFVRKFIPYFLASYGCHLFNIVNSDVSEDREPIYWENQRLPDMRLFILFLAPPGFSKSTFLQHLLRKSYGLLAKTGIETYFKAYMTEAALIGSYGKSDKGEKVQLHGFLERHKNAIVGVEEFSSLLTAAKQEHSLAMDSALLDWATHGEITKDLRSGGISFKTNASLWAGTQLGRERVELRGGMARRFFMLLWVPSKQDEGHLKDAVIESPRMGRLDRRGLDKIRTRVENLRERLDSLEGIWYTDELKAYFKDNLGHNEIPLFRRLALGYAIMKEDFGNDLSVGIDDELKRLMDTAVRWRRRIYREISEVTGLGTDMIVQVLNAHDKKIMRYDDLSVALLLYEVSYDETDDYLKRLKKQNRIRMFDNDGELMVQLIG